ncbi:MAG TPA: isochorismatase family cysteine hydrolase [Candidatus Paceibacterota bacterium]|nr:isochorismatase family cysteine hydrolase [Candidatus Paceibacterota bacterium]
MKPALIVLDIQNIWLDDNADLKKSVEKRLDAINGAIGWFRRNKHPIVVVYHEDKEMGLLPGIKPFEFPPEVEVEETDLKVSKHYPSAFGKTELGAILRKKGCDTVLIAGLSASGCVLATYFGAMDYDLKPYLVQNGVASHSEDHVRYAEDLCSTLAVDTFDQTLR